MASGATSGSQGSSSGQQRFMSDYMSDLSQSQDLSAFLQQNQPTFDRNKYSQVESSTTSPKDNSDGVSVPPPPPHQKQEQQQQQQSSASSSSSSSASASESSSSETRKPFTKSTLAGSHPLPSAHAMVQKQAIQNAALDNCADLNMELTDCLLGKAGTWWDRASMCMKAKERFGKCCRLNKEILQEQGFAKEGNTAAQDRVILDYADKFVQETMKDEKP
ncbi:hypothetical protein BGZ94_008504 [Podila epigama]|nr:hypothetical protein BGZ94_008504 [Podila epigama]